MASEWEMQEVPSLEAAWAIATVLHRVARLAAPSAASLEVAWAIATALRRMALARLAARSAASLEVTSLLAASQATAAQVLARTRALAVPALVAEASEA